MILCLCEAVTDRTIRGAVRRGASSVREVAACTGAGTGCGRCVCDIRALLRERGPFGGDFADGSADEIADEIADDETSELPLAAK